MSIGDKGGYLRIASEADRCTVVSILFKNDYTVRPVRTQKNGRSYEYWIRFDRKTKDVQVTEDDEIAD